MNILSSLALVIGCAVFLYLIYKGALKLDEMEKVHKKKLEIKMREMEEASDERILKMQSQADSEQATTTIVGNLSIGNRESVDKSLIMAQVKCIQCGGSIEPGSKFCRFCGTAVPDITQKTEIKVETVNKARIRREELKHDIEEKKLENEHKLKKAEQKQSFLWALLLIVFLLGMFMLIKH